jgi:hypothetical protein
MNIFRVYVFQITSKGKNILVHERVVKFKGQRNELYFLMVKKYEGFNVQVAEIEEIKEVTVSVEEKVTDCINGYSYYLKGKMFFLYKTYVEEGLLVSLEKAREEVKKIEDIIRCEMVKSLSERVEVERISDIAMLSHLGGMECTVRVKSDLYKTTTPE